MILNVEGLLTTDELCGRLKVCRKTIYSWVRDGINGRKLPIRRRGHRIFFDHDEVMQFLGWENRDIAHANTKGSSDA